MIIGNRIILVILSAATFTQPCRYNQEDSLRASKSDFLALLLLAVCLLLNVRNSVVAVQTEWGEEFVAAEVVVKLARPADLAAIAAQYSLDPTPIDQFGTRPIFRLRITDNTSVEDRVDQLSGDSRVLCRT